MARKGKDFELLIEKFETLKNIGAEIKSPEYVLDADTNTRREVDIGIRFKDSPIFIAFECRDRGSVQDIQWIEQLITKKKSINADILIVVTVSSFTKPAKIKAFKNGIIIRNVGSLKSEDIITIKETSYLEVCYYSDINMYINSIAFAQKDIDPQQTQQNLAMIQNQIESYLVLDKKTNMTLPFAEMINTTGQQAVLKIPMEVYDKQECFNIQFNIKYPNHSLLPLNIDILSANITLTAKKEKIKYPLASVREYKDSITYDLLGQIQGYGIENNNFIIDKPSNISNWQIDWSSLQKPDKIISSLVIYNEDPTKLQSITIKN